MPAGLNAKFRVWRRVAGTDDAVGGAMLSGTVIFDNVPGRYTARRPAYLLLAQGVEIPKMGYVRLVPGTLLVREHDELELIDPTSHTLYGVHQIVIGVTPSSLNPRVGISELIVDVKHVEYAR